ncbi:zinc finger domain-containing protein [Nitrososphaera sp.]|uniref:zinc finger domain-containing protein n=1 Tax=Nitrososphaera sp. TaxID=1971748 RepID=UPI002ED83181
MYSGSYDMPKCNACGRDVHPGEMSESFSCPKCKNARIWRCEGCKGRSKEYKCPACGHRGK